MNNEVTISGTITSIEFSHELLGEKFYIMKLSVGRLSNAEDIIPVMLSDRVASISDDDIGSGVKVIGQFRSYNKHEENRVRLKLFVFANEAIFYNKCDSSNDIHLEGYVCKQPSYRETPLGRQISDILIAVKRSYGKSDYIPCVVWGRNAKYASNMIVGDFIRICGRIQSRKYIKDNQEQVAYEISASSIETISENIS